jgi:hypothetical protein
MQKSRMNENEPAAADNRCCQLVQTNSVIEVALWRLDLDVDMATAD